MGGLDYIYRKGKLIAMCPFGQLHFQCLDLNPTFLEKKKKSREVMRQFSEKLKNQVHGPPIPPCRNGD